VALFCRDGQHHVKVLLLSVLVNKNFDLFVCLRLAFDAFFCFWRLLFIFFVIYAEAFLIDQEAPCVLMFLEGFNVLGDLLQVVGLHSVLVVQKVLFHGCDLLLVTRDLTLVELFNLLAREFLHEVVVVLEAT